jgi:hypothetical protein
MTVIATKNNLSEKNEKMKNENEKTFFNPETEPDRKPTFEQKPILIPTDC